MIEFATWRCARWAAPRDVIVGNGRHLAFGEVFFTADIGASFQSLRHQKTVCRNAECRVVVKSSPSPPLIVAQSQILLQVLVIALNAPTHVCGVYQVVQCGRLRQCGQLVFLRFGLIGGPLDEQPLLWQEAGLANIAARTAHP